MKFPKQLLLALPMAALILFSCKDIKKQSTEDTATVEKRQPKQRNPPPAFTYQLLPAKAWLKQNDSLLTPQVMNILQAVNRTDANNLRGMDSILIPTSFAGDVEFYTQFPMTVPALESFDKILLFSYPTQTFAAYNYGELEYTGPTNMGRQKDPTPTGLYFCNWKAEETVSTFNDEWELKWNFNIQNHEGIGFHEYALPGYPASHSCLRLREADAKNIYTWADQWELKGTDDVLAKGTPVIVFGTYPFGAPKPWKQLPQNPKALDISVAELAQVIAPFKDSVLQAQQARLAYKASTAQDSSTVK